MQKMIGKMARMYPMLIALGFMIVLAAFIVGYLNSQTADVYFAATKAVRETSLLAERASIESTGLWMPPFQIPGSWFDPGRNRNGSPGHYRQSDRRWKRSFN